MSKLHQIILFFTLVLLIVSCTTPTPQTLQPREIMDLRHLNLSGDDFSDQEVELLYATFDTRTKWPASDKMPEGFDPSAILELGKDPGLGIRQLHTLGYTGQGVGIAIIDQTLLEDHVEYKDRLRVYEKAEDIIGGWNEPQMHGPAVASIAVGRTIGVAPEADLYYIATGSCGAATPSIEKLDFSCRAKAVRRIVEINKGLPSSQKIRVLSMSIGWIPQNTGYEEITAAVEEAKAAGIFVISSSLSYTHGLYFHGLGRSPLADPNEFQSYEPGIWWQDYFYDAEEFPKKMLMVPMDSRTTASQEGPEHYAFYRDGGWSWSIPYLAGMYVLAVQVQPDITPDVFWETALKTGRTIQLQHDGKEYQFGVILDPQALIEALESK